MPTLLEELDEMLDCTDAARQIELRHQLTRKCWAHEDALARWRTEVGVPDPEYRINGALPPSMQLLAACYLICLYWSICILLYSTLRIASGPDPELLSQTDPMPYCRRIAEAVAVLLHPASGVYGMHLANFPTALALSYLHAVDGSHISIEKRMFLDAFNGPGHGTTVNRFVHSTQQSAAKSSRRAVPGTPNVPEAQARAWFVRKWVVLEVTRNRGFVRGGHSHVMARHNPQR